MVAGVELHVDEDGDVDVDGGVGVGADGVGEEGVVDDEVEGEVVDLFDGLVGLLGFEGRRAQLAGFVADERARVQVALVLH